MIPVQLIANKIEINPSCKVLKKKDYVDYLKTKSIIDFAKKRAEEITDKAIEKYKEEKQRGYNDGVTESKTTQTEQHLEFIRKTISYLANVETTLADILIKGIKKILGDFDKEKTALNLVKNVLKDIRKEKQIKIRIPSDEYDYVKQNMQKIMAEYKTVQFIDLVADPRLKAGDCILESELGVIDASIDVQIEALKRQFSKLKHINMSVIEDNNEESITNTKDENTNQ